MSLGKASNPKERAAQEILDLAPLVETVSPVTKYAEARPIVNLPPSRSSQSSKKRIPNPKPCLFPATPLIIRSGQHYKSRAPSNSQLHRSAIPSPLRIQSKISGIKDITSETSALYDRNIPQAQSIDNPAKAAYQSSSRVSKEFSFSSRVHHLSQAETRAFETTQHNTNPIKLHSLTSPFLFESPQLKRGVDSYILHLEDRASQLSQPYKGRIRDRQVHSEIGQSTQEAVKDSRHTKSTPVPSYSPFDLEAGSDLVSDRIFDWIDETMNPQAPEFSSRLRMLNEYQSSAIIIGDGRLSPTKNGSYGRSGQINVADNTPRVSSMAGIIENVEMLSPSVYSSASQQNDTVVTTSARPSYRYLLENSEARAQYSKVPDQTAVSRTPHQRSRQVSSDIHRQQKRPASYITSQTDGHEGDSGDSRHQIIETSLCTIDESRQSNPNPSPGSSQSSGPAGSSMLRNGQGQATLSSSTTRTATPRHPLNSESQGLSHNDQNTQRASQTTERNHHMDSNPSFKSIPIYYDRNQEETMQSHSQVHPITSYGGMHVPPTPSAFVAQSSPYVNNFVPPPPRHLDPAGTPADDIYRHFITLHHELATNTDSLKNLITNKHDNIVDRIFQKHDTVVDKLGQGVLQTQQFLHDLSTYLAHVDAHMASNCAGLDVRMRLAQESVAAAASGQDHILEEVQSITEATGDILNLLNAVNQRFTALEAAVEANKCSCARQGTASSSFRGLEGQQRGPQAKTPRKNHAANGNQRPPPPSFSARADSTGSKPTASARGPANVVEPDIRQHPAFSGVTAAAGSSPRVFTPPMVGGDWYRQVTGKKE